MLFGFEFSANVIVQNGYIVETDSIRIQLTDADHRRCRHDIERAIKATHPRNRRLNERYVIFGASQRAQLQRRRNTYVTIAILWIEKLELQQIRDVLVQVGLQANLLGGAQFFVERSDTCAQLFQLITRLELRLAKFQIEVTKVARLGILLSFWCCFWQVGTRRMEKIARMYDESCTVMLFS